MKTRSRISLLVALALSLAWAGSAQVKVTPVISPDGRVLASFSAPAAFSADAAQLMRTGVLLTFTFTVELRRPAPLWFDRTLAQTIVGSSVKYDRLTGAYQVSKHQDGRVLASERKSGDTDVLAWMTTFNQVPLVSPEPLERNAEYYVSVRLHTSPRPWFSLWGRDDGSGRGAFTFIR